jgi:hypothetical protein
VRDFAGAFQRIAAAASAAWARGDLARAARLLKLASPAAFERALAAPHASFAARVADLSLFAPEHTLRLSAVAAADQATIRLLQLRLALLHELQAGRWEGVVALEEQVLAALQAAGDALAPELLERAVAVGLPLDYLRALEFALRVATRLRDAVRERERE